MSITAVNKLAAYDQDTQELLDLVIKVLEDTKGADITVLDVRNASLAGLFDALLVCTATSTRHGAALADKLRYQLKHSGHGPVGFEGPGEMGWALIDAGPIVIHIMSAAAREHYDLEGLWGMEVPS